MNIAQIAACVDALNLLNKGNMEYFQQCTNDLYTQML